MAPRARFETRSAYLSSDFGLEMAKRWFSAEEIAKLGVYGPRSKYAGKPKGQIIWDKVTQGGWVSTGFTDQAEGYVERRVGKVIRARLETVEWKQAWRQTPKIVASADSNLEQSQKAANEYLGKAAAHSIGFFLMLFETHAKLIDLGIKPTPTKYVSPF
jgi:hypothetical protein